MYEDIFIQIRNEAKKRNLTESTINAYCNSIGYFLRIVNKDVSALTTDDVDAFLTEKRLGGLAPRTYNHYHSSIRFFYKRILKMNWEDEDIPRMKLDYSLPTVLSRDKTYVGNPFDDKLTNLADKNDTRSWTDESMHSLEGSKEAFYERDIYESKSN